MNRIVIFLMFGLSLVGCGDGGVGGSDLSLQERDTIMVDKPVEVDSDLKSDSLKLIGDDSLIVKDVVVDTVVLGIDSTMVDSVKGIDEVFVPDSVVVDVPVIDTAVIDTVVEDIVEEYQEDVYVKPVVAAEYLVYREDFDGLVVGKYSEDEFEDAIGVKFCNGADEGRVWIADFPGRGQVLEAKYPKGGVKTSSSGFHTKVAFESGKEYDELFMSYWIYFPADFEFRAGGKLPGLAYQTDDRNMSLRLMWRYTGLIEYYVHYNTKPDVEDFHASINWSLIDTYNEPDGLPQVDQVKFKTGVWNHVELYYKLNTPGEKDGVMRGWLDGKLAIDITDQGDYRQIGEGDIMLNAIYLSTFFGGTDSTFQPQQDQHAFFDDIVVSTQRVGYPAK